ncbi:VOC family protein [Martelella sp. HB161492]|uniref:VOC family protein n=1 Tax=Martelella sp. HB161492 TaxID=2720726 RepID=UPI00158FA726|nr:VOC family protein [Martelella sp. HB161492]
MTTMPLNLIVLYVDDPQVSAKFYAHFLGVAPNALSPGFVAINAPGMPMLGLWSRAGVKPSPEGGPGMMEIGVMLGGDGVSVAYDRAVADGLDIIQPLYTGDFGPTFVVADPDGHRIRVCQPDD